MRPDCPGKKCPLRGDGLAGDREFTLVESRWGHQLDRQSEIETYDVRIAVARTLPIPYMIVVDYVHPQLREHGRRGQVNFVFSGLADQASLCFS